jgi:hypothetical protein
MKELLELCRKMVGHIGKAKFDVSGAELMTIALDLQKFAQLVASEDKKLSETMKVVEKKTSLKVDKKVKEKSEEVK